MGFIRQRHNDILIKAIGPTLTSVSGPSSPNLSPSDAKFQWRGLEQHFTTHYQPPDITIDSPTEWLHQNSNTADVMEDPIVPEEVKCQLRRLPAKSAPGPDKLS